MSVCLCNILQLKVCQHCYGKQFGNPMQVVKYMSIKTSSEGISGANILQFLGHLHTIQIIMAVKHENQTAMVIHLPH